MPITGTFEADFSQFNAAVTGAAANLRAMEGQADHMARAFAAMDADRHFVSLGAVTGTARNRFGALATSLGAADRILAQFGVNISPAVAALREMSVVSGATAASLGLVTTGALVLAAAFAGWKVGGWIKDLTGLDERLDDLYGRLLGVNERLTLNAHQADVIARASAVAGRDVKTFAEATKILADEAERLGATLNQERLFHGVRQGAIDAQRDFRGLTEAQRENITFMLEHGVKAAELEKVFRLHAGTIDVLIGRNKLLDDQEKLNIKTAEDRAAAINKVIAAQQRFIDLGPLKPKDVEIGSPGNEFTPTGAFKTHLDEAAAAREQAEAEAAVARQMEENFLIVGQVAERHREAGLTAKQATDLTVHGYGAVTQAVALSGDAIREWTRLMQYSAQVNAILAENTLFTSLGQKQKIAKLSTSTFGSGGGDTTGGSGAVTINVDIKDSFLDTPDGVRRMADKIGEAIIGGMRSRGFQA